MRLNWSQLGHLSIGQVEQILKEGSTDTENSFLRLFATLIGVSGAETAEAFSLIASQARSHTAEESKPDWNPFFAAIKRERTTRAITEETTLSALSELLWEMHTAQDPPAAPRPGTSERIRPETEA